MATGELEPRVAVCNIGAVDADAAPEHNVFVAPCPCTIEGIGLVCGDEIASHTTNSANIAVTNVTDSQEVASLSTKIGESDLNAIATDTYEALVLSSTASYLELDAGDVLQAAFTETTAGEGDLTQVAMFVRWAPGTGPGQ